MLGVVYFGHTEKHSHVNEAAFDTLSGRHADTNVFVVLDSKHTRLVGIFSFLFVPLSCEFKVFVSGFCICE